MATVPTFDQFLLKVWPGMALRRICDRHNARMLASSTSVYSSAVGGYRGGHYGRLRSSPSRSTQTEEQAASYTYENMIANAMQLYRDDPLTKSIVDVSCAYMGESRPTATTSDPEWNKQATDYFVNYWWPQADARQRPGVDYGQIQNLWERWTWLGGDMLFVLRNGQLLPYEGTQIATPMQLRADPRIINGVRVRASAPWPITHYYLVDRPMKIGQKAKYTRIRRNEAIFAGSRNWRFAMLRSVPDLHSIIDALHAFGRTNDHVQKRIELESMIFTLEQNGALSPTPGRRFIQQNANEGVQLEHKRADWGMHLKLKGEGKLDDQFKFAQMTNPHSNYVPTMEYMAHLIAAGTGFPYEAIMHIYTSGSYTANRAARVDFAKALLQRWAWRNKVLNQPVWNWRIAKAIKAGELPPAPVDSRGVSEWYKVSWTMPHFPHIDEGKEVLADMRQWAIGQESLADWAQQKGLSRTELLEAHDEDIRDMRARAANLGVPLEQYMSGLFKAPAGGNSNAATSSA